MTRALVVHHDVDVADIEADALRRAGYEVDLCQGPIGGSPCPVLHGEPCWQAEKADVLVYDIWASGDGRPELIDELREIHPDKPVVVTSPGMTLDWVETVGRHNVIPVLGPTPAALVAAVDQAVSQPRTPAPERPEKAKAPAYSGPRW